MLQNRTDDSFRTPKTHKYYDFFAGAGLVRLGLKEDWECTWANDIDSQKAEIYQVNFGSKEFVLGDVLNVSAKSLPPSADMAWSSFPCQDLSLAGWRRGMSAERSGTFWAFWNIMRNMHSLGDRPPIVVVENVMGLLYEDNLLGLCEALSALGMKFGPLVIDANWFLPHSRPRVFIVAIDSKVNCDDFTELMPESKPWFPKPVLTAWSRLPRDLHNKWIWWKLPIPQVAIPPVEEILEDLPYLVRWHTSEETGNLLDMMTPLNLGKVLRAKKSLRREVGFLYKRVRNGQQRAEIRFDGKAGCLRTPHGGSSRQTVVVVQNGGVSSRLWSPREAARLMGVPDSFWLPARYNDAYRAMGDGVAVPVARWLSQHLLIPLAQASSYRGPEIRGNNLNGENDPNLSLRKAELLASKWSAGRK